MVARMRADFRLAIVTLFCFASMGIIFPFAAYRLLSGQILVGLVDLAIVAAFMLIMLFAWRTGRVLAAGSLTAMVGAAAVVTVVTVFDTSHLWTFAALMAIYLLAGRWSALATSAVLITVVALHPDTFADPIELFTFLAVAAMVSLFSLIFATRVDSQHSRLAEIAARDGLTGAYNRRLLDHDLEVMARHSDAGSGSVSLAIMDLDEFKLLNDECGHDAGDRVLMELTDIVEAETRREDRFYRFGGEEFVLLLRNTDICGAAMAMDHLNNAIRARLHSPRGRVSVSMGVAQHLRHESREAWLKRADQALLEAKRGGRDQVRLAGVAGPAEADGEQISQPGTRRAEPSSAGLKAG